MTFEEVWAYSSTIPGWFDEESARAIYAQAIQIKRGNFLEIGCWAGRSTSLLLQVAQAADVFVFLLDPFVLQESDSWPAFQQNILAKYSEDSYAFYKIPSSEGWRYMPRELSLVHIDGDHGPNGITTDCSLYLPLLCSGGVVCAHDYGNLDYPAVKEVLDRYTQGWEDLGVHNTLAIRRKP